eukprot:3863377-Rhodomonas_salina.2
MCRRERHLPEPLDDFVVLVAVGVCGRALQAIHIDHRRPANLLDSFWLSRAHFPDACVSQQQHAQLAGYTHLALELTPCEERERQVRDHRLEPLHDRCGLRLAFFNAPTDLHDTEHSDTPDSDHSNPLEDASGTARNPYLCLDNCIFAKPQCASRNGPALLFAKLLPPSSKKKELKLQDCDTPGMRSTAWPVQDLTVHVRVLAVQSWA